MQAPPRNAVYTREQELVMRASIRAAPLSGDRTRANLRNLLFEEAPRQNWNSALTISASGSPYCELMRWYSPRTINPKGNLDCTPAP